MLYQKEVRSYILEIEEAHKKASIKDAIKYIYSSAN